MKLPTATPGNLGLLALILCWGCDSDSPAEPPVSPPANPAVTVTRGFSNSPLQGELQLDPVPGDVFWSYEVDLDADGTIEASGQLAELVKLGYEFATPGIHTLRVSLTFENTERTIERLVVVNDPTALTTRTQDLGLQRGLEGIAVSRGGDLVFVGEANGETVHRLGSVDLTVEVSTFIGDLAQTGPLEGLAVSVNDGELFVANKSKSLTRLSIPNLVVDEHFAQGADTYFVVPEPEGSVLVSGNSGRIARLDGITGAILGERAMKAFHFARSPNSPTIVVITRPFADDPDPHGVSLVSSAGFSTLWATQLQGLIPHAVAFHPDGDRVYTVATGDGFSWLVVLDGATGEVSRRFLIEPHSTGPLQAVANPVASSMDGRWIGFATDERGVYFINTESDLPLLRLDIPCCIMNIAASPVRNVFYVTTGATVVEVGIE